MDRDKKIIRTSILGIVVNIILVVFKATVGLIANSIAIVLDAINNLTDALSSIITIVGIKLAGKKPDKEHPYGHGRIEYIASVVIAIIIFVAGITSFKESFLKILNPEEASYSIVTIIIVSVAVIVKFFLGKYVKKVGKQIGSQSLIASGTDAFMDAIVSFSTLVAAILSLTCHIGIEGYLGIVISLVIIKASIDILRETINDIIGIRVDKEIVTKIKSCINKFDEVQGCYDLILHNYGPTNLIGSAHIQIDDNMTAKEIDKLTRKIRYKVYSKFGIILTIGVYASNTQNEESKKIKEELDNIIAKYKQIIQIHGFYVDEDNSEISFDLIIDFEEKEPNKIRDEVVKQIKEKYPKYKYYAIIDIDFSE